MTALQQWREPRALPLTVDDFAHLHEVGAFVDLSKAELIEGVVVSMSPQHRRHSRVKTELGYRLREALVAPDAGLLTLVEVTVALPPYSAPEPDIVLARAAADDEGFVRAEDAKLVVEVSDSTAAHDLGRKSRLYAAAGIAEYWVVDLPARVLHQFAEPDGDGRWTESCNTPLGSPVAALSIPGLTVETAGLV